MEVVGRGLMEGRYNVGDACSILGGCGPDEGSALDEREEGRKNGP
ncbi:MAG: hypothetical protein ACE5KQ_07375 [Thermoplasmata archaeon]